MHAINVLSFLTALFAIPGALAKPTPRATASCPQGGSYYLYHKPNGGPNQGNGSYAYLDASGYYVGNNDNDTSYYIQFGLNNPSQAAKFTFKKGGDNNCFLSVLRSAAIPDPTGYRAGVLAVSGYHGSLSSDSYLFMFPPGATFDGHQVHANCGIGADSYLSCSALSKNPTQTFSILNLISGSTALTTSSDTVYPHVNITVKAV